VLVTAAGAGGLLAGQLVLLAVVLALLAVVLALLAVVLALLAVVLALLAAAVERPTGWGACALLAATLLGCLSWCWLCWPSW
jgi:hypothetical protein